MAVFVKGFREVETVTPDQLFLAQTKEVTSVSLNMTVGDNPCTFNINLTDVANRFSTPDNPPQEISNLLSNSKYQVITDKANINVVSPQGGVLNIYEFDGFKDGKNPWYHFEYGTLIDINSVTGYRSIVYYRRNQTGNIIERWAFDEQGRVILVSQSIPEAVFASTDSDGATFNILVKGKDGKKQSRPFILLKFTNSDFLNKYQASVADPLKVGRCKIEPMDRVAIFLSQRYEQDNNGNFNIIQNNKPKLIRCFTGLVNTVQMGYNENGENTITVAGEDVTKWLQLSIVAVNPSALPDQTLNTLRYSALARYALLFTNAFAELTTPEVIRLMLLGSDGLSSQVRASNALANSDVRAPGQFSVATNHSTTQDNAIYNPAKGVMELSSNSKWTWSKNFGGGKNHIPVIDIRGMMGSLFKKSSVHVEDPTKTDLQAYLSYKTTYQVPNLFQTEYQTRRDICYKAAKDSSFNFYADRNGHIWFHQPRYNNGWILTADNPNLYIIDDDSIISYGFVEDDTNVYSTCVVNVEPGLSKKTGRYTSDTEEGQAFSRGAYTDEMIAFRFGTKIIELSNPFLVEMKTGTNSSSRSADFYAKVMLQKFLANKTQGQITITGRAELDPGYPVYIPFRNMIYFVESIEHSFSFNGRYESTLHLTYGHKPWESVPELLSQNFDLIHATDGHIQLIKGDITNQPITDNKGKRKHSKIDKTPLKPAPRN